VARELSAAGRRENLRRLVRYVRRRSTRARQAPTRGDYLRFLTAYGRALGHEADWRADWRAIQRRARLNAPAHRLGWWLEERFRAGPSQRDARRPA
jgi:hypothetical protein